jgi:hypothetical protein
MNPVMKIASIAFASSFTLCVMSGCNDSKPVKPPPPQPGPAVPSAETLQTPGSLAAFNTSLKTGGQQIDATQASLAALTDPNQKDLKGAYDQ